MQCGKGSKSSRKKGGWTSPQSIRSGAHQRNTCCGEFAGSVEYIDLPASGLVSDVRPHRLYGRAGYMLQNTGHRETPCTMGALSWGFLSSALPEVLERRDIASG